MLVAVPPEESMTMDTLSDTEGERLTTGDREVESDIVPLNPPMLVKVMVEVPEPP